MAKSLERMMVEELQQEVSKLTWHVFFNHLFVAVGASVIALLHSCGG